MKTLYFIRHAKSSWETPEQRDFDRPLNKRGKHDAPLMGAYLKNKGVMPDLVVASPANRALTTAKIITTALGLPTTNIIENPDLYVFTFEVETIINYIKQFDDNKTRAMLFGHNPTFTALSNYFNNQVPFDNLPTCGCTCFTFATNSWQNINIENARLDFFMFPKLLPN